MERERVSEKAKAAPVLPKPRKISEGTYEYRGVRYRRGRAPHGYYGAWDVFLPSGRRPEGASSARDARALIDAHLDNPT